MLLTTILFSAVVLAKETTTTQVPPAAPKPAHTMTIKDAKTQCKDEGKSGKDLLECIKEKKSK